MGFETFEWGGGDWPKYGKHDVSREEIERLFLEFEVFVAPYLVHAMAAEGRRVAAGRVDGRAMFVEFVLRGALFRPTNACSMHEKEAAGYEACS